MTSKAGLAVEYVRLTRGGSLSRIPAPLYCFAEGMLDFGSMAYKPWRKRVAYLIRLAVSALVRPGFNQARIRENLTAAVTVPSVSPDGGGRAYLLPRDW